MNLEMDDKRQAESEQLRSERPNVSRRRAVGAPGQGVDVERISFPASGAGRYGAPLCQALR
jgi:hypothetical protein